MCLFRCLCVCALEPMCLHVHLLVSVCVCLCESRQYLWEFESSPFVRGTLDWPLLVTFLPGLPASQGTPAKAAHSLSLPFQVEVVIPPRFLAELLSPEPELDLSGLAEELEQEEGLSPEEVARGGTDTSETGGRGRTQVTLEIQEERTQVSQGQGGP